MPGHLRLLFYHLPFPFLNLLFLILELCYILLSDLYLKQQFLFFFLQIVDRFVEIYLILLHRSYLKLIFDHCLFGYSAILLAFITLPLVYIFFVPHPLDSLVQQSLTLHITLHYTIHT